MAFLPDNQHIVWSEREKGAHGDKWRLKIWNLDEIATTGENPSPTGNMELSGDGLTGNDLLIPGPIHTASLADGIIAFRIDKGKSQKFQVWNALTGERILEIFPKAPSRFFEIICVFHRRPPANSVRTQRCGKAAFISSYPNESKIFRGRVSETASL